MYIFLICLAHISLLCLLIHSTVRVSAHTYTMACQCIDLLLLNGGDKGHLYSIILNDAHNIWQLLYLSRSLKLELSTCWVPTSLALWKTDHRWLKPSLGALVRWEQVKQHDKAKGPTSSFRRLSQSLPLNSKPHPHPHTPGHPRAVVSHSPLHRLPVGEKRPEARDALESQGAKAPVVDRHRVLLLLQQFRGLQQRMAETPLSSCKRGQPALPVTPHTFPGSIQEILACLLQDEEVTVFRWWYLGFFCTSLTKKGIFR